MVKPVYSRFHLFLFLSIPIPGFPIDFRFRFQSILAYKFFYPQKFSDCDFFKRKFHAFLQNCCLKLFYKKNIFFRKSKKIEKRYFREFRKNEAFKKTMVFSESILGKWFRSDSSIPSIAILLWNRFRNRNQRIRIGSTLLGLGRGMGSLATLLFI